MRDRARNAGPEQSQVPSENGGMNPALPSGIGYHISLKIHVEGALGESLETPEVHSL